MVEINRDYNFYGYYILLFAIVPCLVNDNYYYFNYLFNRLYTLNYYFVFLCVNIIGLFVFLYRLKFEIQIKIKI